MSNSTTHLAARTQRLSESQAHQHSLWNSGHCRRREQTLCQTSIRASYQDKTCLSMGFLVSGRALLTHRSREERARHTRNGQVGLSVDKVSDIVSWLRLLYGWAVRHGPYPLASQPQVTEPQRVANDRYRTQRHGSTGNHWAEHQPEHRIQRASGDRDTDGVIDEREEEVLADVPHGAPAETPGPDNATEIALHQRYTSALHRHVCSGPHSDADGRLRQGRRVVDALPRHCHHMAFSL